MLSSTLQIVNYAPAKFEVAMSNSLGKYAFRRKNRYIIWPWPWGQGHTTCCPVPSTSCDLCTCQVWSCYVQWFRRRYICKKIHYLTLTLGSRSHEVLPSTLDIMWPMHMQNLKLLLPKVCEEMRLQENTLFDPWHWGQGHTNVTQCPLHHVIYTSTKFEVATSNGLEDIQLQETWRRDGGTFWLWYEINIPYFSNEKAGIIIGKRPFYGHFSINTL